MRIGTKSLLFGAHQFFLHPLFVAVGWTRLFGFPLDPRLWFAFFLHDIGYLGKPDMDGPAGETHPYLGARIMGWLFGDRWYRFSLYHSRFLAKQDGVNPSRLCFADKLATAMTPAWLYLPMARATGELAEYMRHSVGDPSTAKYAGNGYRMATAEEWFSDVRDYLEAWVEAHKDGAADTWTPALKTEDAEARVA